MDRTYESIPPKDSDAFRMLVIGDSHGHSGMLAKASVLARKLGASEVWSVGDFGIWPGRSGQTFLDSTEYAASQNGVLIRVVPGNHDDYDQIDAALHAAGDSGWAHLRPNILVARRGHVHTICSTRIMCLSGAASIDGPGGLWGPWRGPGEGWWAQEIITEEEVETACRNIDVNGGAVELMICHDVPDAEGIIGQADFLLGEQVRGRIRTVAERGGAGTLIAGHWHRHVDRTVAGRREIILSADVNPEQTQWAVVDLAQGIPEPAVHIPAPWKWTMALS